MLELVIPGEPTPFARAGSRGKIRFTPKKQASAMSMLRDRAAVAMRGREPIEGAVELCILATYLIPASWSKKRAAAATWKTSKPDSDNIAKLVKDSLNKIVWKDDAQVARTVIEKRYAPICQMTIQIRPLA